MNLQKLGAAIGSVKGGVAPMAVAPLRFTNTGSDVATIAFNDVKSAGTVLSIRRDEKEEFAAWDLSAVTLQPGEYIEVVGENSQLTTFMGKFVMTGTSISGSGSVMSILYGEDITEEENLIIPGSQFSDYENENESGLFDACKSLVTAPELPATALVPYCYACMFSDSGISAAPELPATELAEGCYLMMFFESDVASIILPATVLVSKCYDSMMAMCVLLTNVTVLFTDWDDENDATDGWFTGVAATGTFTCPAALDQSTRDNSHIPAGWTVVNA